MTRGRGRGSRAALLGVALVLVALTWTATPRPGGDLQPPTAPPAAAPAPPGSVGPTPTTAQPADPSPGATPPSRSPTPPWPTPQEPPTPPVPIAYRLEVRTDDPADRDLLTRVPAILDDPRGWEQAGFDLHPDPDGPYLIVLAEGPEVDRLCAPYTTGGRFSCQNGPVVALNATRWREGVGHWPDDLESYRTMLVNHEVGHLLGMHHLRCPGEGEVAPVMEQQSGSLRGCLANAWPTETEIRLAATHQFELAPPYREVPHPP